MKNAFATKELYDVRLKATYDIEIGTKVFREGETILHFDNIQLADIDENKVRRKATGGYHNTELITWENTQMVNFACTNGVLSKVGLAVLSNSKILENTGVTEVDFSEGRESDENGEILLKYTPITETFFIYDMDGVEVTDYILVGNVLSNLKSYKEYSIDYVFNYDESTETFVVGQRLFANGYLRLTARMRLKDDTEGHLKTALLEIPKVKLTSDLSMRLGSTSPIMVSNFFMEGHPIDVKNNGTVCKIIYLNNDIDADM